ncbi:DUF6215 domain-containing protein [Streptomyces sp. NPDC002206]
MVAALGVGLWALGETSSSDTDLPPARCSGGELEEPPGEPGKVPRRVSGAQLCEALNRPDLAELLGTPGETAKTAGGSGGAVKLVGGKEIATPSARVEFGTYTVTLLATYDRFPVAGSAALLGAAPGSKRFWAARRSSTRTAPSASASASTGATPTAVPASRPAPSPSPWIQRTAAAASRWSCGARTAGCRTTRCFFA